MIKKRKKKSGGKKTNKNLRKRKRSDSLEAEEDEEHRSKILKLVTTKKKLVEERERTLINTKTGSVDTSRQVKVSLKKKVGGKYDAGLSQYSTLEKLGDMGISNKFKLLNPREQQEKNIFDSLINVVERDEDLDDEDDEDEERFNRDVTNQKKKEEEPVDEKENDK